MKIFHSLAVVAIILGCSAKSPETSPTALASSAAPTDSGDSIPFPVFMRFSDFEPQLHFSNDTTYVVNFWATWCKPCVAELPLFYEKLIPASANQPVKVLLVSMDFPKDIEKKLIPFVAERKIAPNVAALADLDYDAWIDKVSTEWDGAIPFTLVYHKEKRAVKAGEMADYEELGKLVESVRF
jgi:thiol-disulfide isomerase/thioredoxin